MSKVFKKIVEDTVGFLIGTDVEFVSLVKYPANRMPFKIIKGGKDMEGMLYKVLVSKDIGDEELKELAKKYEFSIENEVKDESGTHRVFLQADKDVVIKSEDLDMKPLDEDKKIFGLFTKAVKQSIPKKGEDSNNRENELNKEGSNEGVGINDVIDTIYATLDIIYGALYHKGLEDKERLSLINNALSSLSKLGGITLTKLETIDKSEKEKGVVFEKIVKMENSLSRIDEIEKTLKTVDSFMTTVEKMIKDEIDKTIQSFKEEVGVLTTKSTFDKVIKEITSKLEELGGNIVRKSELNEVIKTSSFDVNISSGRFITAA